MYIYNIFFDSPKAKKLTNVELLSVLPFYDSSNIKEISKAFKRYAKSFNIEIIDSRDPLVQLTASKLSIKDLFKDLLFEMKGFKDQITVNVTLIKEKLNGEVEHSSVYFNSTTKVVINKNFIISSIDKSFEEILYRIDNWINEGSGWIIESINSEYVNISKYAPLSGSSFINLPSELKHPKKGLVNIKNKDSKCFLWCHDRHLNPVKKHSERINKKDKEIANTFNYSDISFPVSKNDYCKIEVKSSVCINVYSYEDNTFYPIYVSKEKFNNTTDLLLMHFENKSHYVYIKDFDRLIFSESKNKNKTHHCRYCLKRFSNENILTKHKENCLVINGSQHVKLDKGSITFNNYSRQLSAPFKIYADFESILKETKVSECNSIEEIIDKNSSYTKEYQNHIPCGFLDSYCIDDKFTNDIVVFRGKDYINKFITMILKEYEYCSNVMKKYFNKNLIITVEEEEIFQLSNKCWICDELFDFVDEKVRGHCHISGKFRLTLVVMLILKLLKKYP